MKRKKIPPKNNLVIVEKIWRFMRFDSRRHEFLNVSLILLATGGGGGSEARMTI